MRLLVAGLLLACVTSSRADDVPPDQLESWWKDLASDPVSAYRAVWNFADNPAAAVEFLGNKLKPVQPADAKMLAQLLDELNSPTFAVREKAARALEKLGHLAGDALKKASENKELPLEGQRRIEVLLQKLAPPLSEPEDLRAARAVEVLQTIGSAKARDVLKNWSGGASAATLTREAKEALDYLAKRPAIEPKPFKPQEADVDGDPLPPGAIARLGTTRFRAPNNAIGQDAILFAPGDKQLVMRGTHTLLVMDAETGKIVKQFKGEFSSYFAFAPNGKMLVAAEIERFEARKLHLIDWPSGEEKGVLHLGDRSPQSMVFTGNRRLVVSGPDQKVSEWDLEKQAKVRETPWPEKQLQGTALSPDAALLAFPYRAKLQLWDVKDGAVARTLSTGRSSPGNPIFSPDGTMVAAHAGGEATIELFDAARGKLLRRIPLDAYPWGMAFSPDEKTLATGNYRVRRISLWDVKSGKLLRKLGEGDDYIGSRLVFSSDGKLLAAPSNGQGVQIWDLATGKRRQKDLGHMAEIWALGFSPRGDTIASAGWDGTCRLWDAATGKQLHVLRHDSDQVMAFAFSPNGSHIATSGFDDTVRLWDVATGKQLFKLPGHNPLGGQRCLAFTADGSQLSAWGDDLYLRAFDVKTGKTIEERLTWPTEIKLPSDAADRLESPQGEGLDGVIGYRLIGTISPDGTLFGLREKNGDFTFSAISSAKPLLRLPRTSPESWDRLIKFSPDQKLLAIAPHDFKHTAIEIWSLAERRRVQMAQIPGDIHFIDWSPDRRTLAITTRTQVILWELAAGKERLVLENQGSPPRAAAFSPDGRRLVVAFHDSTSLVLDLREVVRK